MGLVLTDPEQSEWFTDADSVLGMSGASVFDDAGHLIGLFWGGGAGGGLAQSCQRDSVINIDAWWTFECFESSILNSLNDRVIE